MPGNAGGIMGIPIPRAVSTFASLYVKALRLPTMFAMCCSNLVMVAWRPFTPVRVELIIERSCAVKRTGGGAAGSGPGAWAGTILVPAE